MKKLTEYEKILPLIEQIEVEKVYPLSITEGIQKGEIYVDDDEDPTALLVWHYCGFANIRGDYDEGFVDQVIHLMKDPPEGHSGRMALQIENDPRLREMIKGTPMVSGYERYIFKFSGEKYQIPDKVRSRLEPVTSENYELLTGKIIPSFSWESKDAFIKNGFGYCLIEDGRMAACAFSSGLSKDYVDIGVETAEECRGKGYGKIVAAAMIEETLRQGKIPVWGCDIRNEASMRLACSVGFDITGTHPWYTYSSR